MIVQTDPIPPNQKEHPRYAKPNLVVVDSPKYQVLRTLPNFNIAFDSIRNLVAETCRGLFVKRNISRDRVSIQLVHARMLARRKSRAE